MYDAIRTPRGRGKAQRRPARHQADRPGRRADPRDPQPVPRPRPGRDRRHRARRRQPGRRPGLRHRPDRRASPPACPTPSPACRRTASAPPGLEAVNMAAAKVRSGWEDLVLAGGVESMSRVPMGSDGGAWVDDPMTNLRPRLRPAGHRRRPHRHDRGLQPRRDVDAYAAHSQERAAAAVERRPLRPLGRARCSTATAWSSSTTTSTCAPAPPSRRSPSCKPSFAGDRRARRLRRGRAAEVPLGRADRPRPPRRATPRASSTAPPGRRSATEQVGERLGLTPRARIVSAAVTGSEPTIMLTGPAPATRKALGQGRTDRRRHRPVRDQRGVRRRRAALRAGHGPRRSRRSTSTAARSPWATRSARPAR